MSHENSPVWLITGSSQGIGRALLDAVLAANERVVATLRRPEVLASYTEKYPATQLLVLPLDVTDVAQIDATFAAVKEHFGRIDVVVNNAGYGLVAEIEATPEDEARRCFETLYWGPFHIMQRGIPFMRDVNPRGVGGRFISISSIGGYTAYQTLAVYNSAKFALEGLTEALSKEMDPSWNITAVVVELGGFRTEWCGASLKTLPIPPQYAGSPSDQFRQQTFASRGSAIGDPRKAAQAMIRVAGLPKPPLRIQFGTDALVILTARARETIREGEQYAEISHSTNADGVDKDAVAEKLKMYIAQ